MNQKSINKFFKLKKTTWSTIFQNFFLCTAQTGTNDSDSSQRCRKSNELKSLIKYVCCVHELSVFCGIVLMKLHFPCAVCLPSRCPVMAIDSPFSRLQVIFGCGEPRAAHFSVTLLPSLTTISVLVG